MACNPPQTDVHYPQASSAEVVLTYETAYGDIATLFVLPNGEALCAAWAGDNTGPPPLADVQQFYATLKREYPARLSPERAFHKSGNPPQRSVIPHCAPHCEPAVPAVRCPALAGRRGHRVDVRQLLRRCQPARHQGAAARGHQGDRGRLDPRRAERPAQERAVPRGPSGPPACSDSPLFPKYLLEPASAVWALQCGC